jgi:hypothetical protein
LPWARILSIRCEGALRTFFGHRRYLTPRVFTTGGAFTEFVPTSDVLCRLTGTAGCRLQPIGSCRFRRSRFREGRRDDDSPAWPGPPLTPPVKETLSTTQNVFRPVRLPQAFACGPTPLALSGKITLEARAPISPSTCHRPRQRGDGFRPATSRPRLTRPFDHVSFSHACFMLARASYGLPCGYPWVATEDASDRLLLPYHSTPSTRVSSTSAVVARLSPDAPTEDRAFHDAAIRFGGPLPFSTGALKSVLFFFSTRRAEPLAPLSPLLQVPVALSHARAFQEPPRSFLPPPREGERRPRPEVPSIAG